MPNQLHHVIVRSHSVDRYVQFLTDVVGMTVLHAFPIPSEVLEKTMGWPPSDGASVTILGNGDAGMIEVLDVPEDLRATVPEGLAALSFLTDDFSATQERAREFASDVRPFDTGVAGVDLFCCTAGGVLTEFMGSYDADAAEAAAEG